MLNENQIKGLLSNAKSRLKHALEMEPPEDCCVSDDMSFRITKGKTISKEKGFIEAMKSVLNLNNDDIKE